MVGHGRSGSNWALSMLHASEQVHARNEPHLLAGSPYGLLPGAAETGTDPAAMADRWDAFVAWASASDGARDPRTTVPKDFVRGWAARTRAVDWPVRPRIRRALAVAAPELRAESWPPRRWLVDLGRLEGALHVLKVNDLRFWHARWVLEHRPDVPVVHLVRHPGGYLRSAWSRFFGPLDEAGRREEEAVYRGALAEAIEVAPAWREVLDDPWSLPLDEAVAWFWRVNNEEIHRAGAGRPSYRAVRYEDLVAAPTEVARELYAHLGVPWTATAEAAIGAGLDQSVWGPVRAPKDDLVAGWRDALSPRQRHLVERILADGPLAAWW